VKVIKAYCEDQEVYEKVVPFVYDLGSNIARDTKYFRVVELY